MQLSLVWYLASNCLCANVAYANRRRLHWLLIGPLVAGLLGDSVYHCIEAAHWWRSDYYRFGSPEVSAQSCLASIPLVAAILACVGEWAAADARAPRHAARHVTVSLSPTRITDVTGKPAVVGLRSS